MDRHQWLFEAVFTPEADFQFVAEMTIPNLLLTNAVKDPRLERAGIYRITWPQGKKTGVYIGRAGGGKQTVRQRLGQHLQCLQRFGVDYRQHRVSVQLMAAGKHLKHPAKLNQQGRKDLAAGERRRITQSQNRQGGKKFISHNREAFLFETSFSDPHQPRT